MTPADTSSGAQPRALPASPSIEHLKNQAKSLLRQVRAGSPEALARFTPAPAQPSAVRLADAQFVVAREHGFPSWPKLRAYVDSISGERATRFRVTELDPGFFRDRADGLLSQHQSRLPLAARQIARSFPPLAGRSEQDILDAPFTRDDALSVTAREHGFASWRDLERHLDALSRGAQVEPFLAAFVAMKAGDLDALGEWVRRDGSLLSARGSNGNTLLNLAIGTRNAPAARRLIDLGADVEAENVRGWTPLHSAGYAGRADMAETLLDAGADASRSALGDGGTPLVMALFWGHRAVADLLAARAGVLPRNLRAAAGCGRVNLIDELARPGQKLAPGAADHRAFYRPHSGFPVWTPSADPQEVLDEAFVYAARSLRLGAMALLLERGARVGADPYRGTALLWVCARSGGPETDRGADKPLQLQVIKWLLDRGADVNQRATFGGPKHGEAVTALHLAAQNGDLAVVELLVERGADPTIRDGVYDSDPAGWAAHFGRAETAEFLREIA